MSKPQSTIKICSGVMLDNTYQNTIFFDSLADQKKYFEGKVVKTFPSYSYLRRDWDIVVQATMEEALSWTYLFFYNDANAKTYYYFIKKIQYENDNAVRLFIEMDVMQTYAFDYTLARSFVEREHSATDEVGDNLLDEALELGDLDNTDAQFFSFNELCLMMLSTINPDETTEETTTAITASSIDNVFSGLAVYAVDSTKFSSFATTLRNLDKWGKSDAIIAMWMYPRALVKIKTGESWTDTTPICHRVIGADSFTYDIEKTDNFGLYAPRNKKLLTYPYNFLYVHNNAGGCANYHFEQFDNPDSIVFKFIGALSPEGSCKVYPTNYRFLSEHHEEGLMLGGFPTCAWNQDIYKLWLAQNQNQNDVAMRTANMSIATSLVGAGVSVMTGSVMGAGGSLMGVYHGYTQVQNIMAQKKDMSIQPPQSKGGWSANVNVANECQNFYFMRKHVDPYHARMIDEYFDMYGYACRRVKIPNRNVRKRYTYTKTVGCNVYGNLCIEDLTKIKSIFDNGITFWKEGDLIGMYPYYEESENRHGRTNDVL